MSPKATAHQIADSVRAVIAAQGYRITDSQGRDVTDDLAREAGNNAAQILAFSESEGGPSEPLRSAQDLLAERRANVQEMRSERDATARAMLQFEIDSIDAELARRAPVHPHAKLDEVFAKTREAIESERSAS